MTSSSPGNCVTFINDSLLAWPITALFNLPVGAYSYVDTAR